MTIHPLVATLRLVTAVGPCAPVPPAQPVEADEPGSVEPLSDGTARAEGVVERNMRLCEVDAVCWLVLQTGDGPVAVVYSADEGGSCRNLDALRAGYAAEPGDRLEVLGRYHGATVGGGRIATCDEPRFYIRKPGNGPGDG